jgi:hypothetical protein
VNGTTVELGRLEWAGRLVRIPDDRIANKVFMGKPDGRKKAGKFR